MRHSIRVRRGPVIRTASSKPYAPPLTTRYITHASGMRASLRGERCAGGAALEGARERVFSVGTCGNCGRLRPLSLSEAMRSGKPARNQMRLAQSHPVAEFL